MRNFSFIAISLCFTITVITGCTGFKRDRLTKSYFDLNAEELKQGPNNICKGASLMIKEFGIHPGFDSHSFIYRVDTGKYRNDFYNEFITYPARLITEKFIEALCKSEKFTMELSDSKKFYEYRLSGKIVRLYGDYFNPDFPKSVLEIRLILEKRRLSSFKPVLIKTYSQVQEITSMTPEQLVSGWNTGIRNIIDQFLLDSGSDEKHR